MSSSDDSETAEWEREQMFRGTQSRARTQKAMQNQQQTANVQALRDKNVIDASLAKEHVKLDIERIERVMDEIRKKISSTHLEIERSDKKIDAISKQIERISRENFELRAQVDKQSSRNGAKHSHEQNTLK